MECCITRQSSQSLPTNINYDSYFSEKPGVLFYYWISLSYLSNKNLTLTHNEPSTADHPTIQDYFFIIKDLPWFIQKKERSRLCYHYNKCQVPSVLKSFLRTTLIWKQTITYRVFPQEITESVINQICPAMSQTFQHHKRRVSKDWNSVALTHTTLNQKILSIPRNTNIRWQHFLNNFCHCRYKSA